AFHPRVSEVHIGNQQRPLLGDPDRPARIDDDAGIDPQMVWRGTAQRHRTSHGNPTRPTARSSGAIAFKMLEAVRAYRPFLRGPFRVEDRPRPTLRKAWLHHAQNIIRNDSLDPKWIEPVAHGVAHRIVGNDGCGFACRADAAGHSEIAARASLGSFDPDPSEHPRGRSRREPWERRFPYRQSSRGA